jgi:hypothetical protein
MSDPTPVNPDVRHEGSDVNVRGVLVTAATLAATVAAIHLVAWWVFAFLDARQQRERPAVSPLAAEASGQLPPSPRLEGLQSMEGRDMHLHADVLRELVPPELTGYGWVDREKEIVHIPIDRAMRLIVEKNRGQNDRSDSGMRAAPSPANSGRGPERREP